MKNSYVLTDNFAIVYTSKNQPFIVDVDDLPKIQTIKWCMGGSGKNYPVGWYNGKLIRLNRYIMKCPENMVVDHKNHNTYDNRKSNLRIVSRQQNSMNKKVLDKSTSGHTGVVWDKSRSKWQARIRYNGKLIFLGRYNDIENAISARQDAENKYFGQYAYSNSIKQ